MKTILVLTPTAKLFAKLRGTIHRPTRLIKPKVGYNRQKAKKIVVED